jgi:hypothetical protein
MPPELTTATNLVPSAEDATEVQLVIGALVWVQVWANAKFAPHKIAQLNRIVSINFTCRW